MTATLDVSSLFLREGDRLVFPPGAAALNAQPVSEDVEVSQLTRDESGSCRRCVLSAVWFHTLLLCNVLMMCLLSADWLILRETVSPSKLLSSHEIPNVVPIMPCSMSAQSAVVPENPPYGCCCLGF